MRVCKYISVCVCVRVNDDACVCVCVCMRVCVCVRARACVCVCVIACVRAFVAYVIVCLLFKQKYEPPLRPDFLTNCTLPIS